MFLTADSPGESTLERRQQVKRGPNARLDQTYQPRRKDTYESTAKLPEPSACRTCAAVYSGGRWRWTAAPEGARPVTCPACLRAADNIPAGTLRLGGEFLRAHREEIVSLIRNTEQSEKALHPMERLMTLNEENGAIVATTTGVHLARRLGEALHRAYQGVLDFTYGDAEKTIRVSWTR